MRNLRIISLILSCFVVFTLQAQEKYVIVPNAGHLVMSGTSNTSEWMLKSTSLEGDAQLVLRDNELTNISRVIINVNGKTIKNENNKRMSRKAQAVLRVDEHPSVTFFAYGFSQVGDGPRKIRGNISIAGKNADILFDFTSRIQDGVVWIVGESNQAKFSDFGLEPPEDFGGAVQCHDEMKIQVQLPFMLPEN